MTALTYPRDMIGALRWRTPTLKLIHRQELARTAGGTPLARDLGPAIWEARFRSVPLSFAEADAAMADFQTLGGALRPFLLHDPLRPRPASIATDAPLAAATVTVAAIAEDNDALALAGLPAGFVLTAGDWLSILTAAGGRDLYRLARGGTASGAGLSPEIAVTPPLRPQVAAGDVVTLIRAPVEMVLEPGSLDDPMEGSHHRSVAFTARQVLR